MGKPTNTLTPDTRLRDLPTILQTMESVPAGRWLSVYLDASPSRISNHGYLDEFRGLCRTARSEGVVGDHAVGDPTQAIAHVEDYLAQLSLPVALGIALFASGVENEVIATPLPTRPTEQLVWDERPWVEPLVAALDDCERVVVLLFDKERCRVFTIFLGEIERQFELHDDVPGKQATGDRFALSQKRYERHHEEQVRRHALRTISALSRELQDRPFDRLFIAGPEEAIATFEHTLPRPLRLRFAGRLAIPLYATDADVLAASLKAIEATERAEELDAVQSLIDAEGSEQTVLGLEATLGAIAVGRVHRMFIASDLIRDGGVCLTCGRLTADFDQCLSCAGTIQPITDLKEHAVDAAIAQGARVEVVSGLASKLLLRHGGLAAITRY